MQTLSLFPATETATATAVQQAAPVAVKQKQKPKSRIKTLVGSQVPAVGDRFIHGIHAYAVMGYDAAAQTMQYARTYAERHNPQSIALDGLVLFTDTTMARWWISKERLQRRIQFAVTFPWHGGETTLTTYAVSVAKARYNILFRVGKELCQMDPDRAGHAACVSNAKYQLSLAAGRPYSNVIFKVVPLI